MAKPPKISTEKAKVSKAKAIAALRDVIAGLNACGGATSTDDPRFKAWRELARSTLRHVFGEESDELLSLLRVSFSSPYLGPGSYGGDAYGEYETPSGPRDDRSFFQSGVQEARSLVEVHLALVEQLWPDEPTKTLQTTPSALERVEALCIRFPLVVRQLRKRYDARPPLEIEDEYDVQDLMRALLAIEFDDIRPEEWAPSYAGTSARMDFLVKDHRLVLEIKKTRKGLGDKEVANELTIDTQRYASHPDCRTLVCFIYDPEGRIANVRALERDLAGNKGTIDVKVIIAPKGT